MGSGRRLLASPRFGAGCREGLAVSSLTDPFNRTPHLAPPCLSFPTGVMKAVPNGARGVPSGAQLRCHVTLLLGVAHQG